MRILTVATGTEVGKTYVTAALARALAAHQAVLALKPVESGYDPAAPSDARQLALAAGHPLIPPCYALRRPSSPHLAARLEGRTIEAATLKDWVHQQEALHATTPHVTLIETAGGLCSPLSPRLTNLDLVPLLGPALVLLVVPNRLGALHELRAAQLALATCTAERPWVLLNAPPTPDLATATNAAELLQLGWADAPYVLERGAPLPPPLLPALCAALGLAF